MNENKLYCPLLAISNEIQNPHCVADRCAWWVNGINGGGR